MRSSPVQCLIALLGCVTIVQASEPVGTSFSYRGSLTVGGSPASGTYDLKFTLFDALTNGTPVAPPITNAALLINNDLFNVALDFGSGAFNGERRWLEIGVRTNDSSVDFEVLAPRQELAPQPYALYAPNAGSAAVALSLAASSFSGQFSLTNPANAFTGDGSGLTGLNATNISSGMVTDSLLSSNVALLNGNQAFNGSNIFAGVNAFTNVANTFVGKFTGDGSGLSVGYGNLISGGGTIGGGIGNLIDEVIGSSTISGGESNQVSHDTRDCAIAGGMENTIIYADSAVVSGGWGNFIDSVSFGTIGGGFSNRVGDYFVNWYTVGGTIGGGEFNYNRQSDGTIGGGLGNSIATIDDPFFGFLYPSTIGGGESNLVTAGYATISGGLSNSVSGDFGTIPGGQNNFATNFAFAAGYRAKATNEGAFVWASGNSNDFPSATDNSFRAYTPGGFEVDWGGQDAAGHGLKWIALAAQTPGRVINVYNGAYLSTGGTWVDVSDRNAKKDFKPVNGGEILERVSKLPLTTWSYRSEDESARHLGPVAQDFHAAFGLGSDDKHISTLDSSGVALAAIQGLNEIVKEKEARIETLEKDVEALKTLVNTLVEKSEKGPE